MTQCERTGSAQVMIHHHRTHAAAARENRALPRLRATLDRAAAAKRQGWRGGVGRPD